MVIKCESMHHAAWGSSCRDTQYSTNTTMKECTFGEDHGDHSTTGSVHEESHLLPPFSGWQHQRGEKGKQCKGVPHLLSHWEPQSGLRFTRRKDPTACEAEVQHNKAGSYHRAEILLIKFVNAHTSIYSCSAPNVLWYKELGIEQWARWWFLILCTCKQA